MYPPLQWEEAMDRLLRALDVSEKGLAQMTISDKACCLMEWNDDRQSSFSEVGKILLSADLCGSGFASSFWEEWQIADSSQRSPKLPYLLLNRSRRERLPCFKEVLQLCR